MAYGNDVSVYVEDKAGDLGAPPAAGSGPWWLSPDVDLPAHPGEALQGQNDVQIRVHSHEEPFLDEKINAEVYVGAPGFVLSPTVGTKRIDTPGTLVFRPPGVAGTEPIASPAGGTLTFSWTPSADADIDGPGHRCLIVRAFPVSVTPPGSPFTVPAEQHEAQHNIEILATSMKKAKMAKGGAGTPGDPRKIDEDTGLWWERFRTLAAGKRGRRFIVWAFDPEPDAAIVDAVRKSLKGKGFRGFSQNPPGAVTLEPQAKGEEVDPVKLAKGGGFTGLGGKGLFARKRLLAAVNMELGPRSLSDLIMRFDHSNLNKRTAVVLHGVQWDENGEPEGGMTVVALAPTD